MSHAIYVKSSMPPGKYLMVEDGQALSWKPHPVRLTAWTKRHVQSFWNAGRSDQRRVFGRGLSVSIFADSSITTQP